MNFQWFKRSSFATILLLLLTVVLAGSAPVLAEDTILIGGVGPLSQPGTVLAGLDMQWAIETAIADINAEGGVLGRQLELRFYDTQNQPNVAASMAERLVGEGVSAVVGEYLYESE